MTGINEQRYYREIKKAWEWWIVKEVILEQLKYKNSSDSFFKKWLKNNGIAIDSAHNEGKSVAAERFIRTFWTKLISIWLQYQKIYILINWMV